MKDTIITDTDLTLTVIQVGSVLCAGVFFLASRIHPLIAIPALVFLGVAIFLALYTRHKFFSIIVIGLCSALILSLRFDYLVWGDPWSEYGMIQQIIQYQSLNPSVYSEQHPVMHVIIASISLFSGLNSLDLLKFIIPSLSIIGLFAVYRFTEDISSSSETAFFAGLLLLCGTPYLHWTTQGVRETIGIALFALTLYLAFKAIQSHKKTHLALTLLFVCGLILTHHLSSIIFLLIWITFSLTYLCLICDLNRIRTTAIFSLFITMTTLFFMVVWWMGRLTYAYSEINHLMNTVYHSEAGIILFSISIIILYSSPLLIPDKIVIFRSILAQIFMRKKTMYAFFIASAVVCSLVVLIFILGKAGVVLNYPLPMLFNGICMIFLALIGSYYFLELNRLPILAWVAALSLILVLSMSHVVPFVDPLRFMEFLYVPLAIIAAFGLSWIAKHARISKVFPLIITIFVLMSIITAFPSIVFWGSTFEPGHPLFDTRSFVIHHPSSEISAISWLDNSHAKGVIETDTYVGYATRGIIRMDFLTVDAEYSFVNRDLYPQIISQKASRHYVLILSRFLEYMEFGSQWLGKKQPLDRVNLAKIERDYNLLYNNGNAVIFSYSVQ